MLPYSKFLNLISDIDKNTLFDAVRPEILQYAKNVYGDTVRFDAYKFIFQIAYSSTGGNGTIRDLDYENQVENMRKKQVKKDEYRADIKYAHWFYYFTLFSQECDDPHYGQRISETLFDGRSFYDHFEKDMRRLSIRRPEHLGSAELVRLGPLTISLSYDVGLFSFPAQEPRTNLHYPDGQVNFFRALNWRSRITSLQGREKEFEYLVNWATDHTEKAPKLMLVNGVGGSGKSRLVAEVVEHLVKANWSGGFLPNGYKEGDILDGSGKGVVVVIDYPEERSEFVKDVMAAIADDTAYKKPVRILLASRERISNWRSQLNDPDPDRIEEIALDGSQFLSHDDAQKIVAEVTDNYPSRIGLDTNVNADASSWIKSDQQHRLPLFVLAASIHSVHFPKKAFGLGAREILLDLARVELRRVKSYSLRDLNDDGVLQELLGLALFTNNGLTKETAFTIGDSKYYRDCDGRSLTLSLQRTPFWYKQHNKSFSGLVRLEPDRFAAAFLYLAFNLDDPNPALPTLLSHIIMSGNETFINTASRIFFDVAEIDLDASHLLEELLIVALSLCPDFPSGLADSVFCSISPYGAKLAAELCKLLLGNSSTKDNESQALLLNALANRESDLGNHKTALAHAKEAYEKFTNISDKEPEFYLPDLAMLLVNLSNRLADASEYDASEQSVKKALQAYLELVNDHLLDYRKELADTYNNLASVYHEKMMFDETRSANKEALTIRRELATAEPDTFLPDLAMSYNNLGNSLADIGEKREALKSLRVARCHYAKLSVRDPERYKSELANTNMNLSICYARFDEEKRALRYAETSVDLYTELANMRPIIFAEELARAKTNLGQRYSDMNLEEDACILFSEATDMFELLYEQHPDTYIYDFALAMNNLGNALADLGKPDQALVYAKQSVKLFNRIQSCNNDSVIRDIAMATRNYSSILFENGSEDRALVQARKAERLHRILAELYPSLYLSDLALNLDTLAMMYRHRGDLVVAIGYAEEAVNIGVDLVENFSKNKNYALDLAIWRNQLAKLYLEDNQSNAALLHSAHSVAEVKILYTDEKEQYAEWLSLFSKTYLSACANAGVKAEVSIPPEIVKSLNQADG